MFTFQIREIYIFNNRQAWNMIHHLPRRKNREGRFKGEDVKA